VIPRLMTKELYRHLERGKSILLLGPRQTGKTTLVRELAADLYLNLVRPDERLRFERNPARLVLEIEALSRAKQVPLVVLDEVQKVPDLLDAVQDLVDRKIARFVLTGSSARKLRRGTKPNLLPGRVVSLRLDPLSLLEHSPRSLDELLLFGSLPAITLATRDADREADLESYSVTYLEEEVRAEALVRNLGTFSRFLEIAAAESGRIINVAKMSQEVGVSRPTIEAYFGILEDCLIVERVEPITRSRTRKKLTRAPKYLFFDLGVRRVCAREGLKLPREALGHLFEQWVGVELIRLLRMQGSRSRLRFWRDPDGPEVDWVVESVDALVPLEVKLNDAPSLKDIRHLETFLEEHKNATQGFVVCSAPRPMKLTARVTAIPWQDLPRVVESSRGNRS